MNLPKLTAISIVDLPSSLQAWVKSAIISWSVLCVVMSGFALIVAGDRLGFMNWLWLLTLSSMFHVGTYAIIGIPFFVVFWPRSKSCVWRIKFSLPIGAIFGFVGMWFGFVILAGRPFNILDLDNAGGCLVGSLYGMVTASIAWKLKSANKMLVVTGDNVLV